MKNTMKMLLILGAALAGSACTTTAEWDAKYAAGWRPLPGHCTFGGFTPTIDAACAKINSVVMTGTYEHYLAMVNKDALKMLPAGAKCGEHVQTVIKLIGNEPQLTLTPLGSCPNGRGPGVECHVSLLVTDVLGNQFVVDNGAVVRGPSLGVNGVTTLAQFNELVGGDTFSMDGPLTQMFALNAQPL